MIGTPRLGACLMLAAAVLALPGAGCGKAKPATAPGSGRVLLDGKPVADAAVMFEPVDGGVAANEFGLEAAPGQPGIQPKAALPARSADPKTSGLDATVESGGTSVEFTLEPKG